MKLRAKVEGAEVRLRGAKRPQDDPDRVFIVKSLWRSPRSRTTIGRQMLERWPTMLTTEPWDVTQTSSSEANTVEMTYGTGGVAQAPPEEPQEPKSFWRKFKDLVGK